MEGQSEGRPAMQAERPALIRQFGIKGLYGYKNVSVTSKFAASILIAKNGSGKTTLLGAMDAFLKMQFTRLRGLQFSSIHCLLDGVEEELVLTHADLLQFLEVPAEGDFVKLARQAEIDLATLFNFLVEEWSERETWRRLDSPVMSAIIKSTEYRHGEANHVCERLRRGLFNRHEPFRRIFEILQQKLAGVEIVYLPTYRRIELPLPEEKERPTYRRTRPGMKVARGGLHVGNIQFGLSDISDHLSEMNQRILIESNNGYRELSANIINELVDGTFQTAKFREIPAREELGLFFTRLRDSDRAMGPVYYRINAPDLNKIYENVNNENPAFQFLNYFLSELGKVIKKTHDIEFQVEEFINRCNRYLSFVDPSTSASAQPMAGRVDIDAKELRLNKKDLRVHVESLSTNRKISLDALSSGEKQMVSLFARLFLYPGEKIVLIDEPELSLSIDWQREILVDVLDAPLCRQVVAITHSPFVFDNVLEPYASSLTVQTEGMPAALTDDIEDIEQ